MKKKIEKQNGRLILAEGEITGHAHAIVSNDAELYEDGNTKFLTTFAPVTITHEEHKPLTIETPGNYTIGIVQEFNHFEQQANNVQD